MHFLISGKTWKDMALTDEKAMHIQASVVNEAVRSRILMLVSPSVLAWWPVSANKIVRSI